MWVLTERSRSLLRNFNWLAAWCNIFVLTRFFL